MKISSLVRQIGCAQIELGRPRQGYAWTRERLCELFDSLYHRYPIGAFVLWVVDVDDIQVNVLVDGWQRATALYSVIAGEPPPDVVLDAHLFEGLQFDVASERFLFGAARPEDRRTTVDVATVMSRGLVAADNMLGDATYADRVCKLVGIMEVEIVVQELSGSELTIDDVAEVISRLNRGGTSCSRRDLTLVRLGAARPSARDDMRRALAKWNAGGDRFDLNWLMRTVAAVMYGSVSMTALSVAESEAFADALIRTEWAIDYLLHAVSTRLHLDHRRVLFGREAFTVMARIVDQCGGELATAGALDKLLCWYLRSALVHRYAAHLPARLNADLALLAPLDRATDRLTDQLRQRHALQDVEPSHFAGWTTDSWAFPMLHVLSYRRGARDWASGAPIERRVGDAPCARHIFPRELLFNLDYSRLEANAVANIVMLPALKDDEGWRPPEEVLAEAEERHPGVLASHWIPEDRSLWAAERYFDFLGERRRMLAEAADVLLQELGGGRLSDATVQDYSASETDRALRRCNRWMRELGLRQGRQPYELSDPSSGATVAVLDLAWPRGVTGDGEPMAIVVNGSSESLTAIIAQGYRCFGSITAFRRHVQRDLLDGG